jgi:hypothetical protein
MWELVRPTTATAHPGEVALFKSIDAGENWEFIGLKETHHIGRVLIDPKNPDIVYVAALGYLWGTNDYEKSPAKYCIEKTMVWLG